MLKKRKKRKKMFKSPCKDCTERQLGCHSSCAAYKDFTEKKKKEREEMRKDSIYWGYMEDKRRR